MRSLFDNYLDKHSFKNLDGNSTPLDTKYSRPHVVVNRQSRDLKRTAVKNVIKVEVAALGPLIALVGIN